MLDKSNPKIPELLDWKFTSFDAYFLKVQLILSNPLYVSSEIPDEISLKFINTTFFVRMNDSVSLETNYTILKHPVPTQAASVEEF